MHTHEHFAEIIESFLDRYEAQCWQWNQFPTFGSLVQAKSNDLVLIGVVSNIQTGSIDPTRTPFTYQKTEAELMQQQPHIFEFLKTSFTAQLLGYYTVNNPTNIKYTLPPKPCKIHTFVAPCSPEEINTFFASYDFLYPLFACTNPILNLDELLLAIIKNVHEQKPFDLEHIDTFFQVYTLLIGNDYRRVKLFSNRLENMLSQP